MSTNLQSLVAHYLAVNYPSVLQTFLDAAQIPQPDLARPPDPDLRTLVEDYASHQLAKQLESVQVSNEIIPAQDGSWTGWKLKDMMELEMPEDVRLGGVIRSVEGISASNLLTVGVERIPKRTFDTTTASYVGVRAR
jgi:hypothetical protein